jgi:hypothetical protein
MPELVPEACLERSLLMMGDSEWQKLVLKYAMNQSQGGPVKTGFADLDALERELFSKYGGG